ncbi:MAG: hypothetical protein ABI442_17920 [Gemmatimonadaceae bacterium]
MKTTSAIFRDFCSIAVASLTFVARAASAQGPPQPPAYAEFRADLIVGRGTTVQGGLGGVIPLGAYVRFSVDGAAGSTWRDGSAHASGRVDAIGRFLLDPYREMPFGVSLGGGLSLPATRGDTRVRPYLTAVLDVEGRMHGPATPALQIGLGGGARLGVVLRMSPGRWR